MIRQFFYDVRQLMRWIAIAGAVGALAGVAVGVFMKSLEWVTYTRNTHSWLIYFLPLAGLAMGWFYMKFGQSVEGGNDLLLDEIHDPKNTVPFRMAPFILIATLVSQLFGGSVGREGTAVQMGGSLAERVARLFGLKDEERKFVLISGLAAGFSAIFGTPIAGAVFGMEVLSVGRLKSNAIFPALMASITAYFVMRVFNVRETALVAGQIPRLSALVIVSVVIAGIAFGLTGWLFATAVHKIKDLFTRTVKYPPFRPMIAGGLIALSFALVPTVHKYLGLGLPTIELSFRELVAPWDFLGKLLYTALTLGGGFKGGEVTPLFYMGSTLGNALSRVLPLNLPLLAALGFVGVFAGASNTPIASTLVAMEYFGADIGVLAALACAVSYLFSGTASIYHSQKFEGEKWTRHDGKWFN